MPLDRKKILDHCKGLTSYDCDVSSSCQIPVNLRKTLKSKLYDYHNMTIHDYIRDKIYQNEIFPHIFQHTFKKILSNSSDILFRKTIKKDKE